jgi:siroheme synthase (precorrin-2 oxidase/ferrochelatase)
MGKVNVIDGFTKLKNYIYIYIYIHAFLQTSISGGGAAPKLDMLLRRVILASIRASTLFLISLCNLRPKSLNMVVPPDKTIFLYKPKFKRKYEVYVY